MSDREFNISEVNYVRIVGLAKKSYPVRATKVGSVLNFSLRFGPKANPTWIDVTCWQDLADDLAANMADGDRVIVEGYLKQDVFKDKTGAERKKLFINATYVTPADAAKQDGPAESEPPMAEPPPW